MKKLLRMLFGRQCCGNCSNYEDGRCTFREIRVKASDSCNNWGEA